MAASPTQIQARWRKSAFHKTSSYKDSCRKSRISLHQAMRLRFTGKHGVRQCHTAYSQTHQQAPLSPQDDSPLHAKDT